MFDHFKWIVFICLIFPFFVISVIVFLSLFWSTNRIDFCDFGRFHFILNRFFVFQFIFQVLCVIKSNYKRTEAMVAVTALRRLSTFNSNVDYAHRDISTCGPVVLSIRGLCFTRLSYQIIVGVCVFFAVAFLARGFISAWRTYTERYNCTSTTKSKCAVKIRHFGHRQQSNWMNSKIQTTEEKWCTHTHTQKNGHIKNHILVQSQKSAIKNKQGKKHIWLQKEIDRRESRAVLFAFWISSNREHAHEFILTRATQSRFCWHIISKMS